MQDPVARVLAVYRRNADDPSFSSVREHVESGISIPLDQLIAIDAEARRRLGRPCAIERWLDSFPKGAERTAVLGAMVTAALGDQPDGARFLDLCRSISQRGADFATAVARVRLVRALLAQPDETATQLGRDASSAPIAPCDFGPPIAEHAHRFRILRFLGRGATGSVFEAIDRRYSEGSYQHRVVVKVLPPTLAHRAQQEALRGSRVHHPAVVRWLDSGIDPRGWGFVVSELVPGASLDDQSTLKALGRRGAIMAVRQAAEAIDAAHKAGILHLDVKPANILVDTHGNARLCDFGAAAPLQDSAGFTESTPFFAAPEVLAGDPPGVSADVYALGSVLRWCMDELDELGAPALDADDAQRLEVIWSRAMQPAPAARYEAASGLAADLAAWLDRRPLSSEAPLLITSLRLAMRRDPVTWTLGIGAGVALVLLGWIWIDARLAEANRRAERLVTEARSLRAQAALSKYVDGLGELARSDGLSAAPQVLALQWLFGARGINATELHARSRAAQREVWQQIIDEAVQANREDHLEVRLAALCLAVADLEESKFDRAHALMRTALPWWRERVAADDPMRALAEAVAILAEFGADPTAARREAPLWHDRLVTVRNLLQERAPRLAQIAGASLDRLGRRESP